MLNRSRRWMMYLVPMLFILVCSVASAGDPTPVPLPPPPAPKPPTPPDRAKLFDQLNAVWFDAGRAAEQKLVKAAYLGLSTGNADATVRAQLKLPDGVGLVVNFIEKDSPAEAAGLQLHDVLYKLDDQILINSQQLLTLVRLHKPGDPVELTIIREAKQTKLSAKLVEKEVPALDSVDLPATGPGQPIPGGMKFFTKFHSALPSIPQTGASMFYLPGGIKMNDGSYHIELTKSDGKPRLIVKDKDNKSIYDGPVDANAKDLPADVKMKIEMLPTLIGQEDEFNLDLEEQREQQAPAPVKKDDGF